MEGQADPEGTPPAPPSAEFTSGLRTVRDCASSIRAEAGGRHEVVTHRNAYCNLRGGTDAGGDGEQFEHAGKPGGGERQQPRGATAIPGGDPDLAIAGTPVRSAYGGHAA